MQKSWVLFGNETVPPPWGLSDHYGAVPNYPQWKKKRGFAVKSLFKQLLISIKERCFDLWNSQKDSLIFLKFIYFRFLQISFL